MAGGQSRRWCFTLNNPTPAELVHTLWEQWPHLRGGVCQLERGDNGTPHYQGYVQFARPTRLAALKGLLARAHWESARGDSAANLIYCTKEEGRLDGPWRIGEIVDQGDRTDWARLKDDLDAGASELELSEKHFKLWVTHRNGIDAYRRLHTPKRDFRTDLIVLSGPPDTGKSSTARLLAGEDAYWFNCDKWWDDYTGNRVVVFDEFGGGAVPFRLLLTLADRYPVKVEVKGAMREFTSHCIIITSNKTPQDWYDPQKCVLPALYRRITIYLWLDLLEEDCHFSLEYPLALRQY